MAITNSSAPTALEAPAVADTVETLVSAPVPPPPSSTLLQVSLLQQDPSLMHVNPSLQHCTPWQQLEKRSF